MTKNVKEKSLISIWNMLEISGLDHNLCAESLLKDIHTVFDCTRRWKLVKTLVADAGCKKTCRNCQRHQDRWLFHQSSLFKRKSLTQFEIYQLKTPYACGYRAPVPEVYCKHFLYLTSIVRGNLE